MKGAAGRVSVTDATSGGDYAAAGWRTVAAPVRREVGDPPVRARGDPSQHVGQIVERREAGRIVPPQPQRRRPCPLVRVWDEDIVMEGAAGCIPMAGSMADRWACSRPSASVSPALSFV
jgi:hypothetical protein